MVRRNREWEALRPLLFFFLSILWLECVYRSFFLESFFGRGLLYIVLFSLAASCLCGAVCALFERKRHNRLALFILTGLLTFWYMAQGVYQSIFGTVLVTKSMNMAGQALGSYWRETLLGIWHTLPVLILMAMPVAALAARKRIAPTVRADGHVLLTLLGGTLAVHLLAVGALALPTGGVMTMGELYRESFLPDMTVENFGVLTTLRLDVKQSIFGLKEPDFSPPPVPPPQEPAVPGLEEQEPETPPVVYSPNVMDLDFAALAEQEKDSTLKKMHQYFRDREPTLQNEYTGIFEGQNLILMTAEAFWIGMVDKELTPTLWKLAHEGFVFENFYNPLWYYSTVDGEYAATTGLIPSNQVNASQRYAGKNQNSMYFTMGRQLGALGYPTLAYHNNTAKYYDRHLSHPNMGYEFYAGDTGLDVTMSWPQSDLQMMELTLPQALAGELPFHNYYMTVSGHMNYNFPGNAMAKKHKSEVEQLELSDPAKAYLACNMELDRALEYTLRTLEAAGQLENTVICISGDHYPYGLDDTGAIDELAGAGTEENEWEKHRSTLILWSGSMEQPVVVEKPCSSIDIIPTLSNLFGLEYDSRLLAGRDILSTTPGLVIFNNRSFITELGRYSAKQDTFYPNEGAQVPEDYVSNTYQQVRAIMNQSGNILFQDYYRKIGLVH